MFRTEGHIMTQPLTAEEIDTYRKDLPTSLGYYQATVTMMSIFLGFSFVALLQILAGGNAQTYSVLVTFLILSLAFFMTALIFLALTTHQVFRCWKVFFPMSSCQTIGSRAMSVGMLLMILSVSSLL